MQISEDSMKYFIIMILFTSAFSSVLLTEAHEKHMDTIVKFYNKTLQKNIYTNEFSKECLVYNEDSEAEICLLQSKI